MKYHIWFKYILYRYIEYIEKDWVVPKVQHYPLLMGCMRDHNIPQRENGQKNLSLLQFISCIQLKKLQERLNKSCSRKDCQHCLLDTMHSCIKTERTRAEI